MNFKIELEVTLSLLLSFELFITLQYFVSFVQAMAWCLSIISKSSIKTDQADQF